MYTVKPVYSGIAGGKLFFHYWQGFHYVQVPLLTGYRDKKKMFFPLFRVKIWKFLSFLVLNKLTILKFNEKKTFNIHFLGKLWNFQNIWCLAIVIFDAIFRKSQKSRFFTVIWLRSMANLHPQKILFSFLIYSVVNTLLYRFQLDLMAILPYLNHFIDSTDKILNLLS